MSSRAAERHGLAAVTTVILATGLSGCLSIEVPEDFLVLDSNPREVYAVSHDDAVIQVQEFSDRHQGTLEYWKKAVKHQLVDARGYTLFGEGKLTDADGREGAELTFEVTERGQVQRYFVGVFVLEGWFSNTIVRVEFSARPDLFDTYLPQVRKSVATLDP
jgi:hypothetical protein